MLNIKLNVNLDDIIDDLDDLVKRQVPYAAYLALNESVYKGSVDVKKALPFFIQGGPVPFTARGVQYEKAPNKHTLRASIFIPENQWKYMRWVVDGGVKAWSQSEHGIGTPIYKNTRFNKYGNIPGRKRKERVWREMLSQFNGRQGVPQGKLLKKQFIADPKGKGPAIWERRKGGIKLLMTFNDRAGYGKGRFPFHKFAIKYVTKSFPRNFNRHLLAVVNRESKKLKAR